MNRMAALGISTPCVNICVIDALSALCVGCGRSVEEIAGWRDMSETRRRAVMAKLEDRMRVARSGVFRAEAPSRDR